MVSLSRRTSRDILNAIRQGDFVSLKNRKFTFAPGRLTMIILVFSYLLLAVPIVYDVWYCSLTVLDLKARVTLSFVLLSSACPLFACGVVTLWKEITADTECQQETFFMTTDVTTVLYHDGLGAVSSRLLPKIRISLRYLNFFIAFILLLIVLS